MTRKDDLKYDDVLNAATLEDLYIGQGMSAFSIAKKFGIKSHKTVTAYIHRFGIDQRTRSQSLMVHHNGTEPPTPISDVEKEIIFGELLGDGNLTITNKTVGGRGMPLYRHGNKHKEYVEWLKTILPCLCWNDGVSERKSGIAKAGHILYGQHIHSRCHTDLLPIYQAFYALDGVKHVPTGLELTPLMLRHWFLGDGSAGMFSTGYKHGKQTFAWQMWLYCFCFNEAEVDHLVGELARLGIVARKNKKKSHPGTYLRIASESHNRFYELVGDCPVECYQYKFDRPAKKPEFNPSDKSTYPEGFLKALEAFVPSNAVEVDGKILDAFDKFVWRDLNGCYKKLELVALRDRFIPLCIEVGMREKTAVSIFNKMAGAHWSNPRGLSLTVIN